MGQETSGVAMHSTPVTERRNARRFGYRPMVLAASLLASTAHGQLTGATGAHDPSTLSKVNAKYFYFATGQGIVSRSSTNLTAWSSGPVVFSSAPGWTTAAVPGFTGNFWAPDVTYMNGLYHLYYSVSTWGSKISAIGLATSPTLDPAASGYGWTDRGAVLQSNNSTPYNAIDASLFQDTDGRAYMSFGSYSNGIYIAEINPSTGLRVNPSASPVRVAASSSANNASQIEGSALIRKGSYYYLFVNYGTCCSGVDSTYNIRVGRGTSPTGPFLDKSGGNLLNAGGTMFLDDEGNKIGPGHFSLFTENGQDRFGYHYYDGNRNGAPTYGLRSLYWTADAWPSVAAVNPNWTGTSSADWSNSANWSDGVPDAPGAIANFRSVASGRYTIAVDGAARTLATLNFDSPATYTIGSPAGNGLTLDQTEGTQATINLANGSHVIAASITSLDQLGINVALANRTLTLQGDVSAPSLQTYGNGGVTLAGNSAIVGNALIHDGVLTITGSMQTAGYMSIAAVVGDTAQLRLTGTASLATQNDLNIGDTGDANTAATGTLDLRDTATIGVSGGGFFVGSGFSNNTRAVGAVNQSGGTLTVTNGGDGYFVVGGRTSTLATGTFNLSGGTVNANTNVRIGGRGAGTVNQTGGTFNTANYIAIGRFSGSTGSWSISGGTLNHTGVNTQIIVGEAGTGTLTISGSGHVSSPSAIRLGHAGGTGTLALNGGSLTASAIQRGSGTGHLRFNGGTLRASAATPAFVQNLSSAVVSAGGAVIDTNGFAVGIAQPLLHDPAISGIDGGLTVAGGGELTLGGANTYDGATVVNGAALRLAPPAQHVLTNAGGLVIHDGVASFLYTTASPAETIRALLAESFADGFQSGQIRTTGVMEALGWRTVDAARVDVAPTRFGDADLDFAVDFDDLLAVAQHYGAIANATWQQGDFNYDRRVDFDDLLLLAQRYGTPSIAADDLELPGPFAHDWKLARLLVPEPAGLAGLGTGMAVLPRYRRRTGVRRGASVEIGRRD